MKKVNMTLAQRANKAAVSGLNATDNLFQVVALAARATRDLSFVAAARAATLAAAEKVDENLFREIDSKVDAALGR